MTFLQIVSLVTPLDWAALGLIAVAWVVLGYRIEHSGAAKPSVSALMAVYRRSWMEEYRFRENRVFDSQIVTSLRQSTTFFVSTCLLAVGGLLALMVNPGPVQGLVGELTASAESHHTTLRADLEAQLIWMLRLLPATVFLVMAVLKFIWSNRVFGYCSIVMASVPLNSDLPENASRARKAGELNIRAAISFNRGLRAMYFALAAIAWIFGPIVMLVASCAVIAFLWSREFSSHSHAILFNAARPD